MTLLRTMADHLRPPDPRPLTQIQAEIREELEFHIEMRAADNTAAGMSPHAAREDALRRFGNVERIERTCRTILAGEQIMLQRLQAALTLALLGAVVYLAIAHQRAQRASEAALAKMAEAVDRMAADSHALLAGAPPVVVETFPRSGDLDVDPALSEIRVVFSKPMLDLSWSWAICSRDTFPNTTGESHYLSDRKTCVLPVKLESGKTYELWLNSETARNFRDANGRSATPYYLRFQMRH